MADQAARDLRVVAVVVAYNRKNLLVETLSGLQSQTRALDAVIVIDNASTDGSAGAARLQMPEAHVLTLPENVGGAGGFTAGIEQAVTRCGADLVWLMDDDTVPTSTALHELLIAREHAPSGTPIFGSKVVWIDGREHPMNMPRVRPGASRRSRSRAEEHGCYPVRSLSFVSALVDVNAIVDDGLPIAGYFLWNDDFEFTTRLLKDRPGYICRRSVVVHKTKTFGSTDADPGSRFVLEVRNKLWMLRFSRSLRPSEKVVYGAATVLRWLRTWLHSNDRAQTWGYLLKGFVDGTRSAPPTNAEVFAAMPLIARGLERFDAAGRPARS